MAVERKKSLQTYLPPHIKDDYVAICDIRKTTASDEIREFIKREVKKHKGLLND